MIENKRFIFHKNDGEIEDTVTQEFHEVDVYRFDYMIVEKMNGLADENKEIKFEIQNLRAVLRNIHDIVKENGEEDPNCYNCKNCNTYDEGEGYGCVSLCEQGCMNTDGYFDYKYHRFEKPCICPFWELDEFGDESE